MIWLSRSAPVISGLIVFGVAIALAHAQEEFPPPQGKGRVVVVDSGHSGSLYYRPAARQLAQLGYDVVLLDANEIRGPHLPISSGFEGHVGVALQGPLSRPSTCRARFRARSRWLVFLKVAGRARRIVPLS